MKTLKIMLCATVVFGLNACSSLQEMWGTKGAPTDVVPKYQPKPIIPPGQALPPGQTMQLTPPIQGTQLPTVNEQQYYSAPTQGTAPPPAAPIPTGAPTYNTSAPPPSSFGSYSQSPSANGGVQDPKNDVSSFEQDVLSRPKKKNPNGQLNSLRMMVTEKMLQPVMHSHTQIAPPAKTLDNQNALQKPREHDKAAPPQNHSRKDTPSKNKKDAKDGTDQPKVTEI